MISVKITEKNYYIFNPENRHSSGDIWRNLSTLGLLKTKVCSGLVITPACDLANCKTETITYLPIISVNEWLCEYPFYFEVLKKIKEKSKDLEVKVLVDLLKKDTLPSPDELEIIKEEIEATTIEPAQKKTLIDAIRYIEIICDKDNTKPDLAMLKQIFGSKDWLSMREKIVTNSYRGDIHFLPKDLQDADWTAISAHSVVLFRYPITIPISILYCAQVTLPEYWKAEISKHKTEKIASFFVDSMPLKCLTLRIEFLKDILTRYLGLYLRMGSPDFSYETVKTYSKELGE